MIHLKMNIVRFLAGAIGIANASIGIADGWTQKEIIDRISHRSDRVAFIYADDGEWRNPDSCNDSKGIILDPESMINDAAYKEEFAMLLTAKVSGGKVIAFVSGCYELPDGRTMPIIQRIAIY
jgi:hypothetical protein